MTVPLRRRLLVLVAAAILPVAVVSGIALYVFTEKQREQAGRAGLEISRALSTAVDAELDRAVSVLEVLAAAPALDRNELPRFHGVMRRVLAANPEKMKTIPGVPGGVYGNVGGMTYSNRADYPGSPSEKSAKRTGRQDRLGAAAVTLYG